MYFKRKYIFKSIKGGLLNENQKAKDQICDGDEMINLELLHRK